MIPAILERLVYSARFDAPQPHEEPHTVPRPGREPVMRIVSLNVGRPQLFMRNGRTISSAINRRPVAGPVTLTPSGLTDDRVSNSNVHGGPDKAACCYPIEHYATWRDRLGAELPPPSFGENFTTEGLLETAVRVGDVYRIGGAVVQVSQPRQPCNTLALKHNEPRLPRWINELGYTGFYLRVLTPGAVQTGDVWTLEQPGAADLTIATLTRLPHDPAADRSMLARLAELPELSRSWRGHMRRKLTGGEEDDAE
ncbi:MAG: MOSC domain-containing protein [Phycisphaerae bacterium]|nr:MOSC domain-containing protein [Phycisphaerae bacterium]